MKISIKPKESLIIFLGFSLLFTNIPIPSVSAEVNDLSATERTNIQLVIDNLNELITLLEEIRDNGNSRERRVAEGLIAEYTPIRANIESKLADEIKSVPGMADDNPPRYRHGEHMGTPAGAYCGDNQAQVRNDDGTWASCPQGTILLDTDLLDPGNGTPIDENTTEGWQDKWELADIIVHEKYHEKFIDREIQTLQERAWWNNLTPEQKEQRIQEAIERATTARMHAGVFMAQKDFVSMHNKLLEDQEDKLKDEKRDLQTERRTLQRSDGNDTRINEINQRLEEIEQRLEDIYNQTDWLKDRRRSLEKTARNAVAGSHFGFEDCSWPHEHSIGNVAMMVTFPAGLERIDFQVFENQVIDVRITDTIWYGEYEQIVPIIWEPSLYMEMTEPVFSSTIFQPNVCGYIDEMLENGQIQASITTLSIFETYMNPFAPQTTLMPTWIKNNADWWSQGLISDRDFATGLAFMVKEKIIQIKNTDFDPQGQIVISDNLQLPNWIQNNARWWAAGAIGDDDFKSGIQFMLQEEIISFKGNAKQIDSLSLEIKAGTGMDHETKEKILQQDAIALLANNAVLKQLLTMQNFLDSSLDNFSEMAWDKYSDNKNIETMQTALELDETNKIFKDQAIKIITDLKKSNENIDLFFDEVKKNGFDDIAIKNNAQEKLNNIGEYSKTNSGKDLSDAEKYVSSLEKSILDSTKLARQLGGDNTDEMPVMGDSQSSRYSLIFEEGSIEDTPSTHYGIDRYKGARTLCAQNSECDSSLSEICSKRENSTEGLCIPTWFGACNMWTPACIGDIYRSYLDRISIEQSSSIDSMLDTTNPDDSTHVALPDGTITAEEDTTMSDYDLSNDDFTIEANPLSLTLSNGEYGEIIVKTKSLNGWKSPVQITTPIIPSPMTYPPGYPLYVYPTPESETNSIIPVQISGYACTGTYILRVFGYGEHPAADRVLEVHRVNVEINTIREPSLELDSLEKSITIVQGDSKTLQLSFKSLDYTDYSYVVDVIDSFSPPRGIHIETPPTFVSVPEQTTVNASVTISTSENTPTPTTFELPIYAETGLDCYNPYREETSITVNIVPSTDEDAEMVQLIDVTALSIDGQQYPISQFTLWKWTGECNDEWHYHTPTGHAIDLDLNGIGDPDPNNCGFGKALSFPITTVWMSEGQITEFEEFTGYSPLDSEAMMGGAGP